jgi:cytochrome c oxidase subunit 4
LDLSLAVALPDSVIPVRAAPHRAGPRVYYLTYFGLLVLTAITFLASLHPTGLPEMAVALVIACGKSVLVALFFMHLVEQRFANRFVAVVSVLFVCILVFLTAADVATRRTFPPAPSPVGWDDVENPTGRRALRGE